MTSFGTIFAHSFEMLIRESQPVLSLCFNVFRNLKDVNV